MADETSGALGTVHPTHDLEDGGPQPAPIPAPPSQEAPDAGPKAVEPGNEEFPVAFRHFAAELRGTDDEVWTLVIKNRHGHRNMTMTEWRKTHDNLRHENAHWHRG